MPPGSAKAPKSERKGSRKGSSSSRRSSSTRSPRNNEFELLSKRCLQARASPVPGRLTHRRTGRARAALCTPPHAPWHPQAGVLTDAEYDAATDALAQGTTTEAALVALWTCAATHTLLESAATP